MLKRNALGNLMVLGRRRQLLFVIAVLSVLIVGSFFEVQASVTAPAEAVRLIFIHHSCGSNWLSDGNGGLGIALMDNNYFVSDTNYNWGPDSIGSSTDIGGSGSEAPTAQSIWRRFTRRTDSIPRIHACQQMLAAKTKSSCSSHATRTPA
jgi:hypothetical protein